ncbi:MAG: hypothetical protein HFF18_14585 [Oscillospiraceae bacterium]|nr:hypothetical protein [Oscillospiraceae bacterium]
MLGLLLLLSILQMPVSATDNVLAQVPQGLSMEDALWRECPLGDYVADAVREGTGAQIALIPSGVLKNTLAGGCVTEAELAQLLWADEAVYVCTLTAPQLKALMEDSVSFWRLSERETLDGDASAYSGFLQISGFTITADATAAVGERVVSIAVDGQPLELGQSVSITAALPASLKGELPGNPTEGSLLTLIRGHITRQGTVEAPNSGRIRVIGAHAQDLTVLASPWFLVLLLAVFLINAVLSTDRGAQTERSGNR